MNSIFFRNRKGKVKVNKVKKVKKVKKEKKQ